MMSLRPGDVVWVPFPFVERAEVKSRPAVVVCCDLGETGSLFWAVMVTSAQGKRWPGDIAVNDHRTVNLPVASIVRTEKLATFERESATSVGRLTDGDWQQVASQIRMMIDS